MLIIILLFTIILLLTLLIKYFKLTKNQIIIILISLGIVIFIINLDTSINSIISGCKLCFYSIIPTIFPFSFICNLLISYDGIPIYSKIIGPLICKPLGLSKNASFAIAASFICGYPLGTKYSSEIYEQGYIDRNEYLRLINIATNCGPIFILGTIGSSLLKNVKFGYILLIANYLSIIFIGLLTRRKRCSANINVNYSSKSSGNFGENFKNAINNALNTTLMVSAFIVLFSLIIGIIKNNASLDIALKSLEHLLNLPENFLSSLFYGSIELTNGANIIASSSINVHIKLSLISFLCSFSGLSIIAQSSAFMSIHNVPMIKYILLKLLQGIFSFIITFIASITLNSTISASNISYNSYSNHSLCIFMLLLLLVPFVIKKSLNKLLFHIS